jgi:hypothetical protein
MNQINRLKKSIIEIINGGDIVEAYFEEIEGRLIIRLDLGEVVTAPCMPTISHCSTLVKGDNIRDEEELKMDCPECKTKEKLVEYPEWKDGKRVVKYECPVCGYSEEKEE